MPKKVKPIPEGLHTITVNMSVRDAAKAIEFYRKAFGAEELSRMMSPDGKYVWHAELQFGNSRLYLADEAASGAKSPQAMGGSPVSLQLNVEDVDKMFDRAVKAGAKVKMPVADMFWGDRYGALTDPFGLDWSISTHLRDVPPDEMKKAGKEFWAQMHMK